MPMSSISISQEVQLVIKEKGLQHIKHVLQRERSAAHETYYVICLEHASFTLAPLKIWAISSMLIFGSISL